MNVEIFKSNPEAGTTAGYINDAPAVWPGVDVRPAALDEVTFLDESDSFVDAEGWTYYVHDFEFGSPVRCRRIEVHTLENEDQIKGLSPGDMFWIPHSTDTRSSRFVGLTPAGCVWVLRGWRNTMSKFKEMSERLAKLWANFKAKTKPKLKVVPISLKQAKAFVDERHRHHQAPQGHKFSIGVQDQDGKLRGVVVVGRPVSRHMDDGLTAEATRVCTDGARNACSMLYAAAWKAARAMGYEKLITYTLKEESGASLKASNFFPVHVTKGRSWNSSKRPRQDKHPTTDKVRWQIGAGARELAIQL